ncbi:MAG TPA: ribonuclease P protein component [Candidatus Gracilibacteria bacterium]|nr:ribonuclease P protein component [Candidatus Gracilibacteria bacterium]
MLSYKTRLRRSRVEHILKKGQKQANQHFSIKFLRGSGNQSRFAVVVSSKVEPKAVHRNHLRRRVYEALKHAEQPQDPVDMVLITRNSVKEMSFQELQEEINRILSKITGKKQPIFSSTSSFSSWSIGPSIFSLMETRSPPPGMTLT